MKLVRIRSMSAALASLCIGISPAVQAQDAEITELNQRVSELQEAGRTTDAIPFAERASSLTEAEKGPEHPDTAQTLNHLAALYSAMGDYSKAEPLHERALNIIERLPVSPAPENAEFAALNKLRSLRLFNGSVCFLLLLLQGQILLGCRGPVRVMLVHGIFELLVIFLHVLFLLLLVKFVLIFW